jgi:hypothetical protein
MEFWAQSATPEFVAAVPKSPEKDALGLPGGGVNVPKVFVNDVEAIPTSPENDALGLPGGGVNVPKVFVNDVEAIPTSPENDALGLPAARGTTHPSVVLLNLLKRMTARQV